MSEATASLETALNHASQLLGSDPELAGQQATEILSVVGDHPVALMILGISHRLCGRLERAIELLASGVLGLEKFPTVAYDLADVSAAFDAATSGADALKVLVTPLKDGADR